jgi:nickel-dependent lactate racemase
MNIRLAYGKRGLDIDIPGAASVAVLEPAYVAAVPDETAAIADALASPVGSLPLGRRVSPTDTVAVVFSDITRPAPNALIVPAVLEELAAAGVPRERITLFNATGTHRRNTREELAGMLGEDVVSRYRIVQNDARASGEHVPVGTTRSGNEIRIQRDLAACSFKILTGFIEPHFFAGFSGGGKAIMPGMAHLDTVMRNHNAANIDDPRATWAVLDGNPVRAEVEETVSFVRPDFLVNVALNRDKRITRVFSGDVGAAYRAGTEFVGKTAVVEVAAPFDIVVTTNSGWPLDLNLYQAVKGMSAAARVVGPGGSIIVAAECRDGLPDHGSFGRLLREAADVDALLARIRAPGFCMDDQWEAQILALIAKKADVYVYADGLTHEQIALAKLRPCASIDGQVRTLLEKYGGRARVCVLPEGPQTVPACAAPRGGR